jgi:hypothetical protein
MDLEYILPNAIDRYPEFSERFVIVCTVDNDNLTLILDVNRQLVNVSLGWHCSLKQTRGETLISIYYEYFRFVASFTVLCSSWPEIRKI